MMGQVSYLEIGSGHAAQTRQFFEQLFDWTFNSMGEGAEGWFQTPSIKVGLHDNDPEPQFFIFFEVADLDGEIARVKELGGAADEPGPDEPGFGRFCTCQTPQGIRFGLHQRPQSS